MSTGTRQQGDLFGAPAPRAPRAPKRYVITAGTMGGICTSCRAVIFFVRLERGHMPVNPDGVTHYATCPNGDAHRKRPRKADR